MKGLRMIVQVSSPMSHERWYLQELPVSDMKQTVGDSSSGHHMQHESSRRGVSTQNWQNLQPARPKISFKRNNTGPGEGGGKAMEGGWHMWQGGKAIFFRSAGCSKQAVRKKGGAMRRGLRSTQS
jgi:hypothetical protein